MKPLCIGDGMYQLSVNVDNILFEGMWEIPNGVSVNSYIVKGEKTAIIDGVCGWDGVPETLLALLDEIDVKPEDIDYLVINHMEPDHSGWIENFKKVRPEFKIVCTKKAEKLLEAFYEHTDSIHVVKEGDQLDLGAGRVLTFHETPNVHWPEAMMTFDTLSKTLFSCDVYGTFGKVEGSHFDDDLTEADLAFLEVEGLRYFSNVMSTFSPQVKRAVEKCRMMDIHMIAPGHGLIWRHDVASMLDRYVRYSDYGIGLAKREVMILWGSMYGMTEKVVHYVADLLEKEGVTVHNHRVPETSWGQVLTSALASSAIIVATPTYEYHMFPPVAAALEELGRKKIIHRIAFSFGSYGWSSGAQKELQEIMERYRMKWDMIEPVEFNGNAVASDLERVEAGVKAMIEKLNERTQA